MAPPLLDEASLKTIFFKVVAAFILNILQRFFELMEWPFPSITIGFDIVIGLFMTRLSLM